jgi:hypothetical protein
MQDVKAIGNGAKMQFIGKSMSVDMLVATDIKPSIAFVTVGRPMPKPAISKRPNSDVEPKFLFECFTGIAARGMIHGSRFSFQNLLTPRDADNIAVANLLGATSVF